MSKTVVGLFTTPVEAERVKQVLIEEGHSPASIRVLSNESDGFAEGAVAEARSTAPSETGVLGSIKDFFHSLMGTDTGDEEYYTRSLSAGGALLAVTVEEGDEESVISLLEAHGARDVNQEGAASRPTATADGATATSGGAIPVVEEELKVGKRQVQRGGVRVYSRLVETPVEENVRLREEHIRVDRTPVNRPASTADFDNLKDQTIELTETAEEVVVAKEARVVEEVRVGKDVTERAQKVKDTLRHTEIDVEEIPGEPSQKSKSAGTL